MLMVPIKFHQCILLQHEQIWVAWLLIVVFVTVVISHFWLIPAPIQGKRIPLQREDTKYANGLVVKVLPCNCTVVWAALTLERANINTSPLEHCFCQSKLGIRRPFISLVSQSEKVDGHGNQRHTALWGSKQILPWLEAAHIFRLAKESSASQLKVPRHLDPTSLRMKAKNGWR